MINNDCVFCKIIAGELPSYKIYENEDVYAFLDIAKDCYGHTLVIPKKHCTNILDCDETINKKLIEVVQKISKHYVNNCGFEGVNILNANGQAAQQTVNHYHIHIIPRCSNDNLDMWPLKDKKDIDLTEVCNNLKLK